MYYCRNCGTVLPDGTKYCPECGYNTSDSGSESRRSGSITIFRKPAISSKLIKTNVDIDGISYGKLGENEQRTIDLSPGVHLISLQAAVYPELNEPIQIRADENVFYGFQISVSGRPVRVYENGTTTPTGNMYTKKAAKNRTGIVIACIAIFFAVCTLTGLFNSKSTTNSSGSRTATKTTVAEPKFKSRSETVGDWKVTVKDFYYTKSVSVGLFHEYRAEDGSQYCIIELTVQNIGKEAATFLPILSLTDDVNVVLCWGEYEYIRSNLIWSKDNLLHEQLNPLVSTNGNLAFEVPEALTRSGTAPILKITAGKKVFSCKLKKE